MLSVTESTTCRSLLRFFYKSLYFHQKVNKNFVPVHTEPRLIKRPDGLP